MSKKQKERDVPSFEKLFYNWSQITISLYASYENAKRVKTSVNPFDDETFSRQADFFMHYRLLLARDVILNLAKLYHDGQFEDLSFPRFVLNVKVGKYASGLSLETQANLDSLCDEITAALESQKTFIGEIVESRNKAHAHKAIEDLDGYFEGEDLQRLIDLALKILKKTHACILGTEPMIEVMAGLLSVDGILSYCSGYWQSINEGTNNGLESQSND